MDIAIGVLIGLALAYSLVTITWEIARRKYETKEQPGLMDHMQVAPPREKPAPTPPSHTPHRHVADA